MLTASIRPFNYFSMHVWYYIYYFISTMFAYCIYFINTYSVDSESCSSNPAGGAGTALLLCGDPEQGQTLW